MWLHANTTMTEIIRKLNPLKTYCDRESWQYKPVQCSLPQKKGTFSALVTHTLWCQNYIRIHISMCNIWIPDSVDNPTYVDMSIGTLSTTVNQDDEEREFQNPLYHVPDLTPSDTNLNSPMQVEENMYESLYCDTKIVPYSDSGDYYSVPRKAVINEWKRANGGVRGEATSEVIYDTPPDVDNNYEGCCSMHPEQLPYVEV